MRKTLIFTLLFLFCETSLSYLMTEEDQDMLETNFPLKYLFWSGCIVSIGIIRHLIKSYDIVISYSVVCIFVGILWGIAALYHPWMYKVAKVAQSNNILFYFKLVYIPIIIFTTAFSVDTHIFFKSLPQILVISIPAALLCASLTGFMMVLVTESELIFTEDLIFGVITVCTYPMDVLGYLKESNVQTKYIISLLHGESLIATCMGTVVYMILIRSQTGWMVWWYHYVMAIVRFALGFPIGYFFGKTCTWLMKYSYNNSTQLMLLTIVACFTAYYLTLWIAGAGVLSALIVGVMMGSEKGSLSQETQDALKSQWKLLSCTFNGILFIIVGVRTPSILHNGTSFKELILVFVTYLVSNISRFLSLFLFSPILNRLGYGLPFQHLIVCVWCGMKNPLCLIYAVSLEKDLPNFSEQSREIFLHMLGLYVLMLCINGSFLPVVLRALGLAEISATRYINMNNCIKYIYEARTRTIAILKMDRFLSDANWPLVMSTTALKHPYKRTIAMDDQADSEDEEEDFFLGYRFTYCPDCQKHIPNEPTPKEFREMTKEAKYRILKLKKTIYSRQYETAMLTKEGVRTLHQAVEIGLDSEEATIELDGLLQMFDRESSALKYFRNKLQTILQTRSVYRLPKHKFCLFCYNVMNHIFYPLFSGCVVSLNIVVFLLMLEVPRHVRIPQEVHLAAHFTFLLIYSMEVVLRMLGLSWTSIWVHGIPTFFKSFWNVLLFILMSLPLLVIILKFTVYDEAALHLSIVCIDVVMIVLLTVRLFGILTIRAKNLTWFTNIPTTILKYIDLQVNKDKALAYELGKNYIAAEEEILLNIYQIVDNPKIRVELRNRTEDDRHKLSRKLALVQKDRPIVASTVKTKAAIRAVLNSMKDDIYELKVSGWVDDVEYNKLLASLDERYKYVSSMNFIEPSAPKLIFREISYMGDDDLIIDFLWSKISTRKYDPGGVVLEEGEEADGVYILITGLFLVNYIPNETVVNLLKESGATPVIDHICSNLYDQPGYEYFIPGNSIGELSTLTNRTYDGRIIAETHSEAYFLSAATIRQAIEMDPDPVNGFECRIWKTLSFVTAVEVMMNVPACRNLTHDKIQYLVQRAFVPNLSNYKIFVVNEMMDDIILVEGVVVDYNTRDVYTAPQYIPRAVQKLILPKSSLFYMSTTIETKLMVIPAKDFDEYEVMLNEEQLCEVVNDDSSMCLHHLLQQQISLRSKRSKQKVMKMQLARKLKKNDLKKTESEKSQMAFANSFNS